MNGLPFPFARRKNTSCGRGNKRPRLIPRAFSSLLSLLETVGLSHCLKIYNQYLFLHLIKYSSSFYVFKESLIKHLKSTSGKSSNTLASQGMLFGVSKDKSYLKFFNLPNFIRSLLNSILLKHHSSISSSVKYPLLSISPDIKAFFATMRSISLGGIRF